MRAVCVLAVAALLAGCDYEFTASDRCSDEARGEPHVIVGPESRRVSVLRAALPTCSFRQSRTGVIQ